MQDGTNFLLDIGIGKGFEIAQYIIVTFENNNFIEQTNKPSIFNEMDATESFCKIGIVTYPEDIMTFNYGTNNYNFSYKGIVNFVGNYNWLLDSFNPSINHRTYKVKFGRVKVH